VVEQSLAPVLFCLYAVLLRNPRLSTKPVNINATGRRSPARNQENEMATTKKAKLFTPVHGKTGERLNMRPMGQDPKADLGFVIDTNTGIGYLYRSASCGSRGCHCDAVVMEISDTDRRVLRRYLSFLRDAVTEAKADVCMT
jgi:hypothetical protein